MPIIATVMVRAGLLTATLGLLVCRPAFADDPRQVNVPAGDLTVALDLLEKQSGVEIVYRPELLQGLRTEGVTGTLTSKDAVTRLLKGTNSR